MIGFPLIVTVVNHQKTKQSNHQSAWSVGGHLQSIPERQVGKTTLSQVNIRDVTIIKKLGKGGFGLQVFLYHRSL